MVGPLWGGPGKLKEKNYGYGFTVPHAHAAIGALEPCGPRSAFLTRRDPIGRSVLQTRNRYLFPLFLSYKLISMRPVQAPPTTPTAKHFQNRVSRAQKFFC